MSDDLNKYLTPCIWGTGDIATTLGITSQLASINAISTAFDSLTTLTDPNGDVQINLNRNSIVAATMTTNFASVTAGSITDVNIASTSDTNDFVSLAALNAYTYQNAVYYTTMKDTFVFSSTACPSGYTVYLSTSAATYNSGSNTCIPLANFATSDVTNRYLVSNSGSTATQTTITNYVTQLKAYKTSRDASYSTCTTDVAAVSTSMTALSTKVKTCITNV